VSCTLIGRPVQEVGNERREGASVKFLGAAVKIFASPKAGFGEAHHLFNMTPRRVPLSPKHDGVRHRDSNSISPPHPLTHDYTGHAHSPHSHPSHLPPIAETAGPEPPRFGWFPRSRGETQRRTKRL